VTLKKSIELFEEYMKVTDKSYETISLYMRCLDNFNRYLVSQYNQLLYVEDISPDDLEKYLFNELPEVKYSSSTRHNMISAFKSLFSFCYLKGYCNINTGKLVKNIRVETKERDYITELEFRKLMKHVKSTTAYAVVHTLFYTGLRIRECLNLKLADVDLVNDFISVKQGKGNKDRNVPVNDRLKTVLQEYLEEYRNDHGTESFFAGQSGGMCKQYVNRMLKQAEVKAGMDKHISCHILRHSFASNLTERGVDILKVQKLLGHNSIKTTAVYLHTTQEELQEAVDLL
jgi:integrase/recombinase XerD